MSRLPPTPLLDWTAEGAPISAAFGDVYFSRDGGLAETQAVFLNGCGLPDAWRGRARFAVGELGFGSGLNMLALWRLWRESRPAGAWLDAVSIERAPLPAEAAARALAPFPEIADLAARLLRLWPPRVAGPCRIAFPEDGFALTVIHGEAERALAGLVGSFDAWFLDGFAPAKNPDIWSPAIAQALTRLSAPGARLATYTVAASVRGVLSGAGWRVEKRPGFGRKRERMEATLDAPAPPGHSLLRIAAAERPPADALVVGGGIGAAAAAHALTGRGVAATIVADGLGEGASGNPAGLVMPRLDRGDTGVSRLFVAAFVDAVRRYAEAPAGVFTPLAIHERAQTEADAAALADLLADPPLPEDWFAAAPGGALHLKGGLLDPRAAIAWMTERAALRLGARAARLVREGGRWLALDADGGVLAAAEIAILATGDALTAIAETAFLPIRRSRGQIEWGEAQTGAEARVSGTYAAPHAGGALFGATFDALPAEAPSPGPDEASRARNLAALRALAADWRIDERTLSSRASVRATTPDRAPIAGLVPDAQAFRDRFGDALGKGAPVDLTTPAPSHDGLYVLGGLGARGLTLAPLLADRLAREICGAPQALDREALEAIHPARFLTRALKRRT